MINWSNKHERILACSQSFINDNFHGIERQEGILTLSKENKKVETTIQDIRR